MKISVGPIQYYWDKQRIYEFYKQLESSPIDIVYLGETVCSKRQALGLDDWVDIAERLTASGKEVIFSTLVLLISQSELSRARRLILNDRFKIEVNDMSAVNMLAGKNDFIAGPFLNIYNEYTLAWLSNLGAFRWVVPIELDCDGINHLMGVNLGLLETEMLVFGRLPLSFSARCFTARTHMLTKDNCQFRCRDYPDGLILKTQENEQFLNINGIQIQSGNTYNLLMQIPELKKLGVDIVRISPQARGIQDIINAFKSVIDNKTDAVTAIRELEANFNIPFCNGYWFKNFQGMGWKSDLIVNESGY